MQAGSSGDRSHSIEPSRRMRYSPPGVDSQSSSLASLATNTGPARKASAIFSEPVTGHSRLRFLSEGGDCREQCDRDRFHLKLLLHWCRSSAVVEWRAADEPVSEWNG
jgi:hypothetical protein